MKIPLSNFLSKLNWRLMVIHLIAYWFFIHSFLMFSYLHDNKFLMILLNHSKSWFNNPKGWRFDVSSFSIDMLWINLSKPIGLLTGFLISLAITIKKRWYWVNSLIVFLVAALLLRFHLFGWHYLSYVFLAPGSVFKEYSIGYFLVNGLVMLTIGLMLFFLKWPTQFITHSVVAKKQDKAVEQRTDLKTNAIDD